MPADYQSAAAALAIPPVPSPPLSPGPGGGASSSPSPGSPAAPWVRPRMSSSRRLSTRPYALHRSQSSSQQQPLAARLLRAANSAGENVIRLFRQLSPVYKVLAVLGFLAMFTMGILFLVYGGRILAALGPVAKSWREMRMGWIIVWMLGFVTAFPPMIGYSTAITICGFVYDFPGGWPIAATASVAGSTAAFLASRGAFSGYVHRLVGRDTRFVALGQVLRRDGITVLTLIRFCPLPYSLSNGFLATIPSIRTWEFALSTALSTPKLLVHVFIGSRLARLAEEGDTMSTGGRIANYASMIIGGLVGVTVGLVIYRRTMARAAELAAEDPEDLEDAAAAMDPDDAGEEARLMRASIAAADADAAALMDDDDISLWEAEGAAGGYRDSWDDGPTEAAGKDANGRKE